MPTLKFLHKEEKFGLPIDKNLDKSIQRKVRGFWYSRVEPIPLNNPRIESLSRDAMNWIGLGSVATQTKNKKLTDFLSGTTLMEGS